MWYRNFMLAIDATHLAMKTHSRPVHTEKWQSIDISKRPEAAMHEITNIVFFVNNTGFSLDDCREQIQPNLPWADRHFELERVSGEPINPGETWKEWPYALSADKFRTAGEKFSHTYAERYWPKRAGEDELEEYGLGDGFKQLHTGIRYAYGDLNDVVQLLAREPLTRQAYLPVWFPEDTGVVHGERVPCTIGYHFMMRNNELSVAYFIRSCDFVRHFRDDIYLTVRLQYWILEQLQRISPEVWGAVKPGLFMFWAGSLHCFVNDYRKL